MSEANLPPPPPPPPSSLSLFPAAPGQVSNVPISISRWRFIRAYSTTFRVIFSYLRARFRARLYGPEWYAEELARAHKRNARRVYQTLLSLQGLFIKVGQLLSILANFLPDEFRHELEGLQDQVPPRPFSEIRAAIESELKCSVSTHFRELRETPIASASLGQVHEAWLHDGRHVVVKVQHRDIDQIVRIDLHTIRRIMRIVRFFVPVQGLDEYYLQLRELLQQELDFTLEAKNLLRISSNFAKDKNVVFPLPIVELSTRRVLTASYVEGRKISDISNMDAGGIDRRDVAERLVRVYCQMIFVDGLYHADPHPGNVLVGPGGSLVLLDFGAVAQLSPKMREGIPEFLEGVLRRDTELLVKAMRKMGFLARTSDPEVTEKIIEYFHRRFQEEVRLESFNLKDIKLDPQKGLENLLDLRRMNIGLKELSGAFHVPKDWVLLERTLLLLYGTCSVLDPELNPIAIIQPYLRDFVLGDRDFSVLILDAVRDMAMSAIALPNDLRKYIAKAHQGEAEVRVHGIEEAARLFYAGVRQVIYCALVVFTAHEAIDARRHGETALAIALLWGAGVTFTLLLLSSFFARPRSGRWH